MKIYYENIYEHIGKLFYALASEEKLLTLTDYCKLKKIIEKEWEEMSSGDQGIQAHLVAYLYSGIKACIESSISPEKAFELFENNYLLHRVQFSPYFKERILVVARSITHEFSPDGISSRFQKELKSLFEQDHAIAR